MIFQDEHGHAVAISAATLKEILEPGMIGTDREGMTLVAFNDGTKRWVKASPQQIVKAVTGDLIAGTPGQIERG